MKFKETASLARYVGAMLALMFLISGAACAEPVFSFDTTPGKLPKTVVPISYSIELRPDAESLALPGVEVVDIEVREPTARIDAQCGQHDVCCRHHRRRRSSAPTSRSMPPRRPRRSLLRSRSRPGAHRLRIEFHGADQQVRPRLLLRRLSDRQRHEADVVEQTRTVRRAADISVLGRARLQGELCA